MKKLLTLITLAICILATNVYAQQQEGLSIDVHDVDDYLSDVYHNDMEFSRVIEYISNGELKAAAGYTFSYLTQYVKTLMVDHNRIMYTIIAICLLSVLTNISAGGVNNGIYELISVCAISVIMINIYTSVYATAIGIVESLAGFMNVSLPVYFGVSASVTNRLPFSVYGAFVGFVALFQWAAKTVVFPAITVMAVCSIADGVYPSFGASSVKKFISNSVHWLLGLYTTVFIAVLKITQLTSYGTDRLVMSGIRYTVSHAIPVVGSFLSEAAGAVITSTLILHNALGIAAVIIVVAIAAFPFAAIFCLSVIIKLIASIVSPLTYKGAAGLLYSFGECICELAVVLLCACVTFIIGVGIELSALR